MRTTEQKSGLNLLLAVVIALSAFSSPVCAAEGTPSEKRARPQRLLLIGQGPDRHPVATHEYLAGVRLLAKLLDDTPDLQLLVVSADGAWEAGPELIDGADGVVLFVSEGAKWIQDAPGRLEAFQRLADRGGAFVGLHWGIGTRDAQYIDDFLKLVGGCHGGPDRKYKIVEATTQLATPMHPILRGIGPVAVRDEFYYRLKFIQSAGQVAPLIRVPIAGDDQTVAWAWTRPNGGRSFGFSGLHFHDNWRRPEYRRLIAQAVLWTLNRPIPAGGVNVTIREEDLKLPPRGARSSAP